MRMAVLALGAFSLLASSALAEDGAPIGLATKVVDQVTAEIDKKSRTLAEKDGVVQNEIISVSDKGLSEIMLEDETKLALGPGAKMTLDKFVYDPDKSGGAIVLNMSRGAFRFVTGLSKKPAYVIKTPTASITVRGTIFDVYVEETGAIWMLLHEGEVRVCNDRGACQVLDDPCKLVRVDGGGTVGDPGNWNGLRQDEDVEFETAFPFIETPPAFDPEPRFERTSVEKGTCAEQEIKPRKTRRAEPDEPRDTPKKRIYKAEPKYDPPPKKVKKAEPKYDPPPKKVQKAEPKYDPPKKKKVVKYEEKPKKKYKEKGDGGATAAKALGLAIGIGLAIGASKGGGGKKGGGYNY